jgi:hypothetical protein
MRYLLLLLLFVARLAEAQKVTVTGAWNPSLTAPTVGGANYTSSALESSTDQVKITLLPQILYLAGTVSVSAHITHGSTPWPSDLTLSIRRTGTGSAGISIATFSGGGAYQQLTPSTAAFFSVTILISLLSQIADIPVQYRLDGISVLRPVGDYSATVTYTISP